jgi:hypothetical protein
MLNSCRQKPRGWALTPARGKGFDRAQYSEILGLGAQGPASALIVTLGYRLPTDIYMNAPKVRCPKEEMLIRI